MAQVNVTVTDTAGETREIAAPEGRSLMDAITGAGFDDMLAMCGGNCACATCHVYVDGPDRFAALPPMKPDEDDLLDSSDERRPTSRLSCQIRVTEALEGLHVTIAPAG